MYNLGTDSREQLESFARGLSDAELANHLRILSIDLGVAFPTLAALLREAVQRWEVKP